MLKMFLAVLLLLLAALLALGIRLFFGKTFVHTDIKGNRALEERGIKCAVEQEMETINKQSNPTK